MITWIQLGGKLMFDSDKDLKKAANALYKASAGIDRLRASLVRNIREG